MEYPTIHEQPLDTILAEMNLLEAIYFTWTKRKPTPEQAELLQAVLVVLLDHGPEALSTKTARLAMSGGAAFHAALAAGMLAAGKHHGSMPLQESAMLFQEVIASETSAKEVVAQALKDGRRLPGFGHRVYETDPRTQLLLKKVSELGLSDEQVKLALEIEKELEEQKGKKLCLNVDGMIGALLPALGLSIEIAPAVFLVARSVGISMHLANEQKEKPASLRRA